MNKMWQGFNYPSTESGLLDRQVKYLPPLLSVPRQKIDDQTAYFAQPAPIQCPNPAKIFYLLKMSGYSSFEAILQGLAERKIQYWANNNECKVKFYLENH